MKKYFSKVVLLFMFCLASVFVLVSCTSSKKNEIQDKKVEISKVTCSYDEIFDTSKMKIEKTWSFHDSKSINIICNKTVVGNLEPVTVKPADKGYNTYYVKIFYGNSIEEWIFWLDENFSKGGTAENKVNRGRYKSISKKDVGKIGKLLKG